MSILPLQISIFLAAGVLYIFFAWRRLNDDYLPEPIFNTSLIILFVVLFSGYLATFIPIPHFWFWGAVTGFIISFVILVNKYKFKLTESYEAFSRSLIFLLAAAYLSDYLANAYMLSLYAFISLMVLFLVFILIDLNYRKFTWYKSGRVGISGLLIVGIYFALRAAVAAYNIPMISLLGRMDFIPSGVIAFLHFFYIYHLSES